MKQEAMRSKVAITQICDYYDHIVSDCSSEAEHFLFEGCDGDGGECEIAGG